MINIKTIEKELNKISQIIENECKFYLVEEHDQIVLIAEDSEEFDLLLEVEVNGTNNITELVTNLISEIYEQEINWRSKKVKSWNNYSRRKIKSLGLALEKSNDEKVTLIQKELINTRSYHSILKAEIDEYKVFVKVLFELKDELTRNEVA